MMCVLVNCIKEIFFHLQYICDNHRQKTKTYFLVPSKEIKIIYVECNSFKFALFNLLVIISNHFILVSVALQSVTHTLTHFFLITTGN